MSGKTYAYLENEVIIWARNRGIPQNSSPFAQALKTLEEAGELLDAAHRGDKAAMADAYGDGWSRYLLALRRQEWTCLSV